MPYFANLLNTLLLTIGLGNPDTTTPRITVTPAVETESVSAAGDSADDAVVWVHPTDSAQSLILATNKKLGMEVYDLAGKHQQTLPVGRLNNVDLRWLQRPGQEPVAVVTATDRTENSIALFAVDNASKKVTLTAQIPLDMKHPYGLCMYDSGSQLFVFVNDKGGHYQQWQILPDLTSGSMVREFSVESTPEGCAVDDITHTLYFGLEESGLYAMNANHDGDSTRRTVDEVGLGRLAADVEGVAIYRDETYELLFASSQGNDTYAVYELQPPWSPLAVISIVDGNIDGTSQTDGLAINPTPMGSFGKGIWVVQDDNNTQPRSNQNFKYIDIESVLEQIAIPVGSLALNKAPQ